jgi:hypothetical protein
MAQTRKNRRRKRRGTQSGRVDQRPRGRPATRAEARQRARSRGSSSRSRSKAAQGPKPPTWGSAALKGSLAAALFFALTALVFKQPIGSAVGLSAFLLLFYIPMSYYVDRFVYHRHLRKQEQERIAKSQRGAGEG